MKCDVFGIKEMLYYTIMSKKPYRGRIFLWKKWTVKTVTTLVSPTKALPYKSLPQGGVKTILTAMLRPAERWKSCLIESAHLVLERPLRILLASELSTLRTGTNYVMRRRCPKQPLAEVSQRLDAACYLVRPRKFWLLMCCCQNTHRDVVGSACFCHGGFLWF